MTSNRLARYCRCGSRLARDNADTRCSACAAAGRGRICAAPEVPADFWDEAVLREALASRHMGRVIRAWRTHPHHGRDHYPQDRVAVWAGITQAQLSRIENGPPMAHLDRLIQWARVLRIPAGWLWFALPDSDPPFASDTDRAAPGVDLSVDRREAIRAIAGSVFGVALLDVEQLDRSRSTAGQPVFDRRPLMHHAEIGETFARLYQSADPRTMLPLASAYADDLLDRFDRVATAELAHLVVGVHAQVGLWACHANVPAQAYRYLSTACEVAAAADDRPLHARALGALSYAYSSAPRGGAGGRPYRALRLLDEALAMAVGADAFTRGWLATWRADQHATLGDRAAAQADLELAWTALEVGDDGNLTGFFARRNYGYGMRGHLDSVRATVHGLAGETVQAEKVFNQVQAQAANGRRRAASYAHQALAYAKAWQPDPEAACACLLKSVDIATAEGYAMGVRRTFGVRAGLRSDWARLPCVREVDDRLRPLSLA